jgi:hypothetical protein
MNPDEKPLADLAANERSSHGGVRDDAFLDREVA